VRPADLALIGRNGQRYYWYGMGHSLLMLPADILARGSVKLISRFREPPWWLLNEDTVVSCVTSTLVCTLAILLCFHFLRLLSFTVSQSLLGACTLLFGTTFLHYTQTPQENNYLLLLTLAGFCFQYDWFRSGSTRSLFFGSMAFGANLLTRLTTGQDLLAGALFILLCLWFDEKRKGTLRDRLTEYARICIPCYAAFFAADRLYQYHRFGSVFTTYLHVFGAQFRFSPVHSAGAMEPSWPWSTPFWEGFLGPLVSPDRSIFLFDPLIILTFVLLFLLWKRLAADLKAFAIASAGLLFAYISFYAKYYDWSGAAAWGDRYVTTPVELLAMISIPLLMRHQSSVKGWLQEFGMAIAAVSVTVQGASVFFWYYLEDRQIAVLGQSHFVIGLRLLNIVAFALGTQDKWGLSLGNLSPHTPKMNTPNFFPFLVTRQGIISPVKSEVLVAMWTGLLAALAGLLFLITMKTREREDKNVGPRPAFKSTSRQRGPAEFDTENTELTHISPTGSHL